VTRKPPDPPKRKLKLNGGKESEEEKELYLNVRELADLEIRRQWPALVGEPANPEKSLAELSAALFAQKDAERTKRWDALFAQAQAKEKAGDIAGAIAAYDWILAQDPFYARRGEMVAAFRSAGRIREAEVLAGQTTIPILTATAARKRPILPLVAALVGIAALSALAFRRVRA
jgi:hypothetical protein